MPRLRLLEVISNKLILKFPTSSMDPTDRGILGWTWRPVLELGLASKDSFVYLLHFLLPQEQRHIFDNDTCIQPVQRYVNSMQKKPKSWSVKCFDAKLENPEPNIYYKSRCDLHHYLGWHLFVNVGVIVSINAISIYVDPSSPLLPWMMQFTLIFLINLVHNWINFIVFPSLQFGRVTKETYSQSSEDVVQICWGLKQICLASKVHLTSSCMGTTRAQSISLWCNR